MVRICGAVRKRTGDSGARGFGRWGGRPGYFEGASLGMVFPLVRDLSRTYRRNCLTAVAVGGIVVSDPTDQPVGSERGTYA